MARADANGNDCSEVYFRRDSCKIILKKGDLLREDNVDVLVIPTPVRGQQERNQTYPIFEKFLSNAEKHLKDEIKRISSQLESFHQPQFITNKKPSYILTMTPSYQNPKKALQLLEQIYSACLNLATDKQCQTIAFPTIGCGQSCFPMQGATESLFNALNRFEGMRLERLKEIRIVVFTKETLDVFTNIFMNMAEDNSSKIKFIQISTASRSNRMPSGPDDQYEDDFHDENDNSRGPSTTHKAGLNPESPEFRPKNKGEDRDVHRYYINDGKTELHIMRGDILKVEVDAIVNAANESMLGGSGVDGVIHKAAGNELYRACKRHKEIDDDVRLPTGRSRILLSYGLSKTTYYIINTAGPRYDDHPPKKCERYLTSCYETSLELANLYDLKTIAYTAISCGIFGYPAHEGATVALSTIDKNAKRMKKILFVLRDEDLYKVWIEIAERLNFESMDDTGSKAAVASKQSTAQPPKGATSDESDRAAKRGATPSKESKPSGEEHGRHASHGKANERAADPAHGKSIVSQPKPEEEEKAEGAKNRPGDDSMSNKQEENSSNSDKKPKKKDPSKQSSEKKTTSNKDPKDSVAAGPKGASQSRPLPPLDVGRGKTRK